VIINPGEHLLKEYHKKIETAQTGKRTFHIKDLPANHPGWKGDSNCWPNLDITGEIDFITKNCADGIGLARTSSYSRSMKHFRTRMNSTRFTKG